MEVITVESGAFKTMMSAIEQTLKTVTVLAEENRKLKDNRLMSIKEASEYTGFGIRWINDRKDVIGYFQAGKDIKFYKENIDQYIQANSIQRKLRTA